ncbi:hypothetical protein JW823_06545 [bacterium]|nr:hypothetical protein [candidate division CSSED10-310 bacterium]
MDDVISRFRFLVPVGIDLGCLVLYVLVLPWLTQYMQKKSPGILLFICGFYGVFCVSVFVLRSLATIKSTANESVDGLTMFSAVMFSVMMVYIVIDTSGMIRYLTDSPMSRISSDHQGLIGFMRFTGPIILCFIILAAYPAALLIKPRLTVFSGNTNRFILETMALLGINLMIIVTMAHWSASYQSEVRYTDLRVTGKIFIFLVVYVFFLIFYGAPRWLFFRSNPSISSAISFVFQTGFYVWNSLSKTAWE